MEDEEISLYDYYLVIKKRWKIPFSLFIVSVIITAIVSFFLPRIYKATTSIYVVQKGGLPSILTSLPIPVDLFSSISEASPSDYLMVLLKSNNIKEEVIKKLNLSNNKFLFGDTGKKISREKMLVLLDEITKINYDKKGTITVAVETKNPKLSAEIANTFIDLLEKSVFSSTRKNRIFLENQMEQTKKELSKAEEQLRNFQEKDKTISLDTQAEKIISSYVDAKSEKMASQIALQEINSVLKRVGYFPEIYSYETEKVKLQTKLKELDKNISNYESQFYQLPERALLLARLMRDVKLYGTIYETLSQQYVLAKITEQKEDIKFQVIDKAYPPEKHSKPSKKLNVIIAGMLSLFVGVFLTFSLEYVENVKKRQKG